MWRTPRPRCTPATVGYLLDCTVLSIVFGLATAVCFASGLLANSRSIRVIGNFSVLAWIMMIGLAVTLPFTIASGWPENLGGSTLAWFIVSGVGNLAGLLISFYALQVGKVGVVAPILACEGAIAATISAVMGESIAPIAMFILVFIVAGVVVSAVAPDPQPIAHERPVQAVLLAIIAAACFGVSLFATGFISSQLPIGWVLLPARLVGVLCIALPLIILGRLRVTRSVMPLLLIGGTVEVLGFTAYSIGARESVAVTSVLSSQFATFGAIGAYLLFKERLGRLQVTGVVMLIIGVSALTIANS